MAPARSPLPVVIPPKLRQMLGNGARGLPQLRVVVQAAEPVGPRVPAVLPRAQLPLAGVPSPGRRTGTIESQTANQSTSTSAGPALPAAGPRGADGRRQAAAGGRPATATAATAATADAGGARRVDVDRIVEEVHRRFVRRLAIEGERRGVR
jgi:hypothetical protein